MPDTETAVSNRLLGALPPDELARVVSHAERRTYDLFDVLVEADSHLDFAYFPEDAIISVVRPANGELVEAGTVGREGMAGFAVLFGTTFSASKLTIQHAGEILILPFATMHAMLPELPVLRDLIGRYILAFLDQVGQGAACNARHSLDERCAKWMLTARDRVDGESFTLTHAVLAQMLGVHRPGVTLAASKLQKAGLIRYVRGRITILDHAGLEAASCECYGINRDHFERLLGIGSVDGRQRSVSV
jgi:cAMP-binding proteins - catabolite gene activator and regulatory subunit of cAMP-dependent protein kinases